MVMKLWVDPIPPSLRRRALQEFAAGDMLCFLGLASNEDSLRLVAMNMAALKAAGMYELALMHAFTATRTNNSSWSLNELRFLFQEADRAKLLAAGDPGHSRPLRRGPLRILLADVALPRRDPNRVEDVDSAALTRR